MQCTRPFALHAELQPWAALTPQFTDGTFPLFPRGFGDPVSVGIIVSAMVAQQTYHAGFLHVTLTLYAMHCSNVARTPHPNVDGDLRLA